MKVRALHALIAEHQPHKIIVDGHLPFDIDSDECNKKQNWVAKEDWSLERDVRTGQRLLYIKRLEKELDITINRPIVNGEPLSAENEKQLEDFINTPITCLVYHKPSGDFAPRDITIQRVPDFAASVIANYRRDHKDEVVNYEDFAIIQINWANKHVAITRIEDDKVEQTYRCGKCDGADLEKHAIRCPHRAKEEDTKQI